MNLNRNTHFYICKKKIVKLVCCLKSKGNNHVSDMFLSLSTCVFYFALVNVSQPLSGVTLHKELGTWFQPCFISFKDMHVSSHQLWLHHLLRQLFSEQHEAGSDQFQLDLKWPCCWQRHSIPAALTRTGVRFKTESPDTGNAVTWGEIRQNKDLFSHY